MPGLIQRYNAVAEYSALMSTNPTASQRKQSRREEASSGSPCPRTPHAAIREEASEWYDAIAPPLEDLQAFIRRMQADPDLAQDRVFAHLCLAVVLCALFAVVVVAVREDSYGQRVLDAPSPNGCWAAAARFAALAVCVVVVSVIALKCVIFGVAEACAVVVAMETREQMQAREERGVPTSGLVLGGMLM